MTSKNFFCTLAHSLGVRFRNSDNFFPKCSKKINDVLKYSLKKINDVLKYRF